MLFSSYFFDFYAFHRLAWRKDNKANLLPEEQIQKSLSQSAGCAL